MSNDLILMGVVIVLFGLYFTLQVELNKVRNQFTHYLLKPGSISKEQREKYLKEPEMEAIRRFASIIGSDFKMPNLFMSI